MPGPFSARTLRAVGACTRALAPGEDADAAFDGADAASLGRLRAFGDRLALRRRFHDPSMHQDHRPPNAPAVDLFTALEDARLDALGAAWLPGIARNLLAHPGAEDDGVRWLAFQAFSGRQAPRVKAEGVAQVQTALPSHLVDALAGLAAHIGHPAPFAAAAAAWARAAAPLIEPPQDTASTMRRVALPTRFIERPQRRGRPGESTPAGRRPAPSEPRGASSAAGIGAGPAGAPEGADGSARGYHAYTRAHDRVVNAAALAERSELARLRGQLDAELRTVRSTVARLAKRLLRVLMAQQVREWHFDQDDGLLDGSRLAVLVASRGSARPFKQERESPFPSTVVTLLLDHSGSMRGRPMLIAALTVEIFARVLERCGVRCEVLGFTTRDWDGGAPAREWAANGYPEHPGRLNALEHVVIKSADVPWRRARAALGLFLRDEMLKENIDGEAVDWAHARLLARPERRRILVVVSDGTPMDEATLAANGHDYLEAHLQAVVAGIETRSPVHLAAIGIGHDVSWFYRNATRIARIDELGPALGAKLIALLDAEVSAVPATRRRRTPRRSP